MVVSGLQFRDGDPRGSGKFGTDTRSFGAIRLDRADGVRLLGNSIDNVGVGKLIVSGESGALRSGKAESPLRWIVHSIDGTRNFLHGFPYYAVSIALANRNDVTHAVVLDPVHDELFTAIRGRGAQRNATYSSRPGWSVIPGVPG